MSKRATILIADDDADFVKMLRVFLEHHDFEILTAFEGVRTVELANKMHPHLIILDLKMPAGGGETVLENLRSRMETEKIPVLVVTALGDPQLKEKILARGAQGFLQKPFEDKELLSKIHSLIPKESP